MKILLIRTDHLCVFFVNNTFLRNELSSTACFSFPYFIFHERRRKKILGKEPEIVSTKQYITKNIVVARVRVASRRLFHPQGVCQCLFGKYGETRNFYLLSVEYFNGSRHLVFWSLGTLTGLRDRVQRLVS
jgi:hypothetical protein